METVEQNDIQLEQGSVIEGISSIPVSRFDSLSGQWQTYDEDCPDGVVVISQTCDVIRAVEANGSVQVAKIRRLEGQEYNSSACGERPRYAPLSIGDCKLFADLGCIATVLLENITKDMLRDGSIRCAENSRLFRDLIGRRFARFPFPDAVVLWCNHLRTKIAPKARRNGNQGKLLRKVTCIRIEDANNWRNSDVYQLSVVFLLAPGELPLIDDEEENELPDDISSKLSKARDTEKAEQIAKIILDNSTSARSLSNSAIVQLWQMLVDTWVNECNYAYGRKGDSRVRVNGVAEIESEDTYSYARMKRSEQLDLDHLSRMAIK